MSCWRPLLKSLVTDFMPDPAVSDPMIDPKADAKAQFINPKGMEIWVLLAVLRLHEKAYRETIPDAIVKMEGHTLSIMRCLVH